GPDQDRKLYDSLVQQSKFTPGQAEIVLQLLHSFSDQDLNRPETFETLIAYLGSSRPQVRELANWHLTRIVPAGKSIKYDAGASKEDREKAAKAWKQLIPDGKLPPAPKA